MSFFVLFRIKKRVLYSMPRVTCALNLSVPSIALIEHNVVGIVLHCTAFN
jgi:hypothetical protein